MPPCTARWILNQWTTREVPRIICIVGTTTSVNSKYFVLKYRYNKGWASQVARVVKRLPANAGDIRDQGQEDTLGEGTATHSRIFAWRIPRTEEPAGLQSTGLQRIRHV